MPRAPTHPVKSGESQSSRWVRTPATTTERRSPSPAGHCRRRQVGLPQGNEAGQSIKAETPGGLREYADGVRRPITAPNARIGSLVFSFFRQCLGWIGVLVELFGFAACYSSLSKRMSDKGWEGNSVADSALGYGRCEYSNCIPLVTPFAHVACTIRPEFESNAGLRSRASVGPLGA